MTFEILVIAQAPPKFEYNSKYRYAEVQSFTT
jgi:hypothetical protein